MFRISNVWRRSRLALLGLILCCTAAAVASILFRGVAAKSTLVIVFLGMIVFVSVRFGRLSGTLGTLAAGAIFAIFLLPPIGTFAVTDTDQRFSLAWLLIGGIAIAFLIGSGPEDQDKAKRS